MRVCVCVCVCVCVFVCVCSCVCARVCEEDRERERDSFGPYILKHTFCINILAANLLYRYMLTLQTLHSSKVPVTRDKVVKV